MDMMEKVHFYTHGGYGWGKRAFSPFCKSLGTGIAMGITFLENGQARLGTQAYTCPTLDPTTQQANRKTFLPTNIKATPVEKSSFALCIVLLLKKVLTHASCRLSNIRTR